MKKLIVLFLSIFSVSSLMAQTIVIPKDVVYETEDDYKKYEKDVIAIAKWLVVTPLTEFKAIDAFHSYVFIMNWTNGSSSVDIKTPQGISKLYEKNSYLKLIYIACSAQYQLENATKDSRASTEFALEQMIRVYQTRDNHMKFDRRMNKLVKAYDKGELDKWIDENIKF